jgi:hypothetical protein
MIALDLDKSKRNFFDRKAILARLTPAERRVVSKFGAFVRRTARSSIRQSKKSAQPGQPPKAHTKDKFATLRNILFAYDPARHSVVIGPVKIRRSGFQQVAQITELGGTVSGVPQRVQVQGKRKRWRKTGRKVTARYAPHPFMQPAFQKEQKESLPSLWRGAI